MTPLLPLALILSIHPATITTPSPHHHQGGTIMASGGGTNNQNHGAGGSRGRTNLSFPERHPSQPTEQQTYRAPRNARNITLVEHTNRPNTLR